MTAASLGGTRRPDFPARLRHVTASASLLGHEVQRDSGPPLDAVRLLRPAEVTEEAIAGRIGAHDDRFAAEALRLADDSLRRLPRPENVSFRVDPLAFQRLDRVLDGVAPLLPLLLVRI